MSTTETSELPVMLYIGNKDKTELQKKTHGIMIVVLLNKTITIPAEI